MLLTHARAHRLREELLVHRGCWRLPALRSHILCATCCRPAHDREVQLMAAVVARASARAGELHGHQTAAATTTAAAALREALLLQEGRGRGPEGEQEDDEEPPGGREGHKTRMESPGL